MMKRIFIPLGIAIMVFMVAFAFEAGSESAYDSSLMDVHHVVRDGTWVDASSPYKLPEKKHFWTKP